MGVIYWKRKGKFTKRSGLPTIREMPLTRPISLWSPTPSPPPSSPPSTVRPTPPPLHIQPSQLWMDVMFHCADKGNSEGLRIRILQTAKSPQLLFKLYLLSHSFCLPPRPKYFVIFNWFTFYIIKLKVAQRKHSIGCPKKIFYRLPPCACVAFETSITVTHTIT